MTTTVYTPSPTRRLALAGTYNFRDLGGYAVGSRTTKWNKLFRSDALHKLDESGRDTLRALPLGVVIDLREPEELTAAPNALDNVGHRTVHVPIYNGALDLHNTGLELGPVYAEMISKYGVQLTQAVRAIAESGDDSVVVHCAAGKDRTGVTIALTLAAIGVDERDIITDYAITENMLAGEWAEAMVVIMRERGLPETADADALIVASPAELMRKTLQEINSTYGGAEQYLKNHGMTDTELDNLRAALIA
jgi:protein-tyrosine phosphatase